MNAEELTTEIVKKSTDEGIDLAEEVIRAVIEREEDDAPATVDAVGILFNVWVSLSDYLVHEGYWTPEELINEIEFQSVTGWGETCH